MRSAPSIFGDWVAKNSFRGLVDIDDVAVLVDRNDGVGSSFEPACESVSLSRSALLVLFPHQQLSNLRADWSHRSNNALSGCAVSRLKNSITPTTSVPDSESGKPKPLWQSVRRNIDNSWKILDLQRDRKSTKARQWPRHGPASPRREQTCAAQRLLIKLRRL